jgi:adenylate cyclase
VSAFSALLVRFGLEFADPAEEAEFVRKFSPDSIAISQIFLIVGALTYYAFFTWDQIIDPIGGQTTHLFRGLVVAPIMAFFGLFLSTRAGKARIEFILLANYVIGQSGLVYVYSVLAHGYDYSAVGFILMFMGTSAAFPIRTKYLILASIFGLATTVAGHILADNARDGWIMINVLAMLTASVFGTFSSFLRERTARQQFNSGRDLAKSQDRVEQLLNAILPKDIVDRIQGGETTIADSLGEVSVIFAEMVGFARMADRVGPQELVGMLNRIFSEFDVQAERFGMQKIKTIGDIYMAIGGRVRGDAAIDHAEDAADFAIAIRYAAQQIGAELGIPIDLRIGLHIGPVVAGVIGVHRPVFDCWGDAVNLAARLEKHAPESGIMVSESANWRLRRSFTISPSGEVNLKGIGQTPAFLLERRTRKERGSAGLKGHSNTQTMLFLH